MEALNGVGVSSVYTRCVLSPIQTFSFQMFVVAASASVLLVIVTLNPKEAGDAVYMSLYRRRQLDFVFCLLGVVGVCHKVNV